jgi:hypothetical protein
MRRRVSSLAALLCALAAVLATSPGASAAGTYTLWSCKNGAGLPAPIDGWSSAASDPSGAYPGPTNSCSDGKSFGASWKADYDIFPAGTGQRWQYTAPAGVTITNVTMERSMGAVSRLHGAGTDVGSSPTAMAYRGKVVRDPIADAASVIELCQDNCNKFSFVAYPDPSFPPLAFKVDGTTFGFSAGCARVASEAGPYQCQGDPGGRGGYTVERAKIVLADPSAPTAADITGSVLDAAALSGTRDLSLTAADRGSGIWDAEVKVDATVIRPRGVVNANGGLCSPTGDVDGFLAGAPCKPSVSLSLPIDTTRVADGAHTLTVDLWDAAGNRSRVLERAITVANSPVVDNPLPSVSGTPGAVAERPAVPAIKGAGAGAVVGAANGSGGDRASARFVQSKKPASVTTTYGRAVTIKGQLVDRSKKPIAGAHLDVLETVALKGAAQQYVATIDTDAKGRFAYRPAVGPQRKVAFAYVPKTGDAAYATQLAVSFDVKAAVTLAVTPKSTSRKNKVTFSGRVTAGPLPPAGARVVIETRGKHAWLIVAALNTNASGAFAWSHKFSVPLTYHFRARMLRTADLAILPGVSALRPVKIR